MRLGGLFAALASVLVAGPAAAQDVGFRLDRYQAPPSTEDGLALQLPRTLGDGRWSASLAIDWAHAPLVIAQAGASDDAGAIVSSQLTAQLGFAYGISDRFEVFARLPITVLQSGEGPTLGGRRFEEPSGTALGDPAIGGSVRLLGEDESGFQLGGALSVSIPMGSDDAFAGDGGLGLRGALLPAYVSEWVTVAANVGMAYRPERTLVNGDHVGSELQLGGGVHVTPGRNLRLMAELYGGSNLDGAFGRLTSPLEAVLGGRYTLGGGLAFGAALGAGLTQAVGVPDVRVLVTVGFARPRGEGSRRRVEGEARARGGEQPAVDPDRDGIVGASDRCPEEAETANRMEDDDGCPDEVVIADGEIAVPAPIVFEVGRDRIMEESFAALAAVAQIMADHPDIRMLSIEGHTSDEGSERHDLELSQRRARAVVRWLREHGVSAQRLRSEGFGSTRPLAPNDSDENRARNRRVQFRIYEQVIEAPR